LDPDPVVRVLQRLARTVHRALDRLDLERLVGDLGCDVDPVTRGFVNRVPRTLPTARIFTGFVDPTFARSGRRSFPRRSISFARIRREAIAASSSARTIGTTWIVRGGSPRRTRSSFRAFATPSRPSPTTIASTGSS